MINPLITKVKSLIRNDDRQKLCINITMLYGDRNSKKT